MLLFRVDWVPKTNLSLAYNQRWLAIPGSIPGQVWQYKLAHALLTWARAKPVKASKFTVNLRNIASSLLLSGVKVRDGCENRPVALIKPARLREDAFVFDQAAAWQWNFHFGSGVENQADVFQPGV